MNPTVLFVEDDRAIMESMIDFLALAGFEVMAARNGLEAMAAMEERVPDVIVCDIRMPGMGGYEFYEALRARQAWAAIPFIFLSARNDEDHIRKAYGLEAEHYLTKPFDSARLLQLIKMHLARSHESSPTRYSKLQDWIDSQLNRG